MHNYKFSTRSLKRLETCEQSLQTLMKLAIGDPRCPVDMTILEGHRTLAQQKKYVEQGTSHTLKSKHLFQPSRAVDVAPFPIDWNDISRFEMLAAHIKTVAKENGITVYWGGDWRGWRDCPHWQTEK
jgi:peptidoglycan L-alanyl-D-glutamate endopeptidase CwlK